MKKIKDLTNGSTRFLYSTLPSPFLLVSHSSDVLCYVTDINTSRNAFSYLPVLINLSKHYGMLTRDCLDRVIRDCSIGRSTDL